MKILRITREKYSDDYRKLLESHNIKVEEMEPSILSAMTSMKIAKAIDRDDYNYIIVENIKDAIASLSAKKITKKRNHKTIYRAKPNTRHRTGLAKEIIDGIDGWIFASNVQRECYSPTLRNTIVIDYLPIVLTKIDVEKKDTKTLTWIGDIEKPDRLKTVIDQIDDTIPEYNIRICGTGNARDTMPVVRWARNIKKPQNVVWVGENYNINQEISQSIALVKTNEDLTATEYLALYNDIPVIEPEEIPSYIEGKLDYKIKTPNQNKNIETIIAFLLNID